MTYKFNEMLNVRVGQDWYKFSHEGTTIVPKQRFINRSEAVMEIWDTMGRNGYYYGAQYEVADNIKILYRNAYFLPDESSKDNDVKSSTFLIQTQIVF